MFENNSTDKDEFNNAIQYFQNIINSNIIISKTSPHKMGATILGIKTNISGIFKLHTYIFFFPFKSFNQETVPYCNFFPNIYLKDICFHVDKNFYQWIYEEMRKQKSIVIMLLDDNILKVVEGFGDPIISIDKICNEKKEWMELDFEEWYEKETFNNVFTIIITNPYLYTVPFPVKPIFLKTERRLNNYCTLVSY
jgi:hypothetical protein